MPKKVLLYRIFVASPGDCRKERELVRQLIADWNVVYGMSRSLFLEAVLWETHALPELGDRPQGVINRQLVDTCDALVGIFRGRLGSPSGAASSGTVEEVEIFRTASKPVLLYFHNPKSLGAATPAVNAELASYRREIGLNGLVWAYRGYMEFVRDVAKHLAMTMTKLAGTPETEATNTEEVLTLPPQAAVAPGSAPLAALMTIREKTYFVWKELEGLPEEQAEFACEIREVTYQRVRDELDVLAAEGLLTYKTELAYVASFDEMPVLTILVKDVSPALRQMVERIAREHGPRTLSDA